MDIQKGDIRATIVLAILIYLTVLLCSTIFSFGFTFTAAFSLSLAYLARREIL